MSNKQKPSPGTPNEQSTNKPLDKTQLFINSIKESISVSDMKSLYPKSTSVKLQKRKGGPNNKTMQ